MYNIDLAVSEVQCIIMGKDGREDRLLGKIWHCWDGSRFIIYNN